MVPVCEAWTLSDIDSLSQSVVEKHVSMMLRSQSGIHSHLYCFWPVFSWGKGLSQDPNKHTNTGTATLLDCAMIEFMRCLPRIKTVVVI